MNKKIIAAIDIGSYNCRMVIVNNLLKNKILKTISVPTNLIKNLSYSNEFTNDNIKKTINCLIKFSRKMLEYSVDSYRCIATEACRQVINSDFFVDQVKKKTGLTVEVISASEEAQLCFIGCRKYLKKINNEGVLFDIGGGSTEFSIFDIKNNKFLTKSISIGVINFSEKVCLYGKSEILNQLDKHFKLLKNNFLAKINPNYSLGSCSTVSTLSAVSQNLTFFDRKKIEGSILEVDKVKILISTLKNLEINEMLKHPCIKQRYPLLLNGMEILEKIITNFPIKRIVVSQSGLTGGIIESLS